VIVKELKEVQKDFGDERRTHIIEDTGESMEVDSPTKFPPPSTMREIAEPVITAMIITSEDSVGAILQLCEEKRGVQKNFEYLSPQRVMLTYECRSMRSCSTFTTG